MTHLVRRLARRSRCRTFAAVIALSLAACSDSTDPRAATGLTLVSGNDQTTTVGTAAASALVVAVTDQNGAALSGTTVSWAVSQGSGTLSASTTTTDSNGQASVTFTPNVEGASVVTASVSGISSTVQFTVTASAASGARGFWHGGSRDRRA
jgi:hypothetical protein